MKTSILLYISVIIAITSIQPLSAESIPKIGKTCPQGYHIDGASGYCIPFDAKHAPLMLPKIGNIALPDITLMVRVDIVPHSVTLNKKI